MHDQSFKEKVIKRVLVDGEVAAAVARELGIKAWLVQSWVRGARRTQKRGKSDRHKVLFDGHEYWQERKFLVADAHRRNYTVRVLCWLEGRCELDKQFADEMHVLFAERKGPVLRIRKGLYKFPNGVILESDDPKAI